jgi:hypothetical protein
MRIENDFSLLWHGFCKSFKEIKVIHNIFAGLDKRVGMREGQQGDIEKMKERFCDFVPRLENRKNNITLARDHLVLAGSLVLRSIAAESIGI